MAADGDLFRQAPKAVLDYFDGRSARLAETRHWRDIPTHEHALAFTVARSAGFDILADLKEDVRRALAERQTYEEFGRNARERLKAKGWWGKAVLPDSDGTPKLTQLGSERRLRIIHWANLASAEAAGDWARIQESKAVLPYLEYMASVSERKRPLHLSWVGTTLPVDDPWWRTHYPPNGWFCKCRARSRGFIAEKVPDEKRRAPQDGTVDWFDKGAGRTVQVPAGVDPGWDSNPGLTREIRSRQELVAKLDALPSPARREAIAAIRQGPEFAALRDNVFGLDHMAMRTDARARQRMQAVSRLSIPVTDAPEALATLLGSRSRTVLVSAVDMEKISGRHAMQAQDFDDLSDALAAGAVLELQRGKALARFRNRTGKPVLAVFKNTSSDELMLNSLHREPEVKAGGGS